jgi:hypothetical protein
MTAIVIPDGFTREDLLSTVDREILLRTKAYPRWVTLGRMSRSKMDTEIAAMRAVRATLAQLPSLPPAQTELFGVGR